VFGQKRGQKRITVVLGTFSGESRNDGETKITTGICRSGTLNPESRRRGQATERPRQGSRGGWGGETTPGVISKNGGDERGVTQKS